MTAEKLNMINRRFWGQQNRLRDKRISDRTVYKLAMKDMLSESLRRVSIGSQKSLEQALADAANATNKGRRAGRRKGLRVGRRTGLREGRSAGLREGRRTGLRAGRTAGLLEGWRAGQREGRRAERRAFSQKGRRVRRKAPLQTLIESIYFAQPEINDRQLLYALKKHVGNGVIHSIESQSEVLAGDVPKIHYFDSKNIQRRASVFGLKDRLSRLRKKYSRA